MRRHAEFETRLVRGPGGIHLLVGQRSASPCVSSGKADTTKQVDRLQALAVSRDKHMLLGNLFQGIVHLSLGVLVVHEGRYLVDGQVQGHHYL